VLAQLDRLAADRAHVAVADLGLQGLRIGLGMPVFQRRQRNGLAGRAEQRHGRNAVLGLDVDGQAHRPVDQHPQPGLGTNHNRVTHGNLLGVQFGRLMGERQRALMRSFTAMPCTDIIRCFLTR